MTTTTSPSRSTFSTSAQRVGVQLGVPVALAAVGLTVYAAYGDQHQKDNQTSAVPFMAVAIVAVTAVVFGYLLPRLLRTAGSADHGSGRAGRNLGIAALATLVVFWSIVPFVLGTAAASWGVAWRRHAASDDRSAKVGTQALVLGVVAVVLDLVFLVVGNTALSGP
jgi:hypothetical protein